MSEAVEDIDADGRLRWHKKPLSGGLQQSPRWSGRMRLRAKCRHGSNNKLLLGIVIVGVEEMGELPEQSEELLVQSYRLSKSGSWDRCVTTVVIHCQPEVCVRVDGSLAFYVARSNGGSISRPGHSQM